MDPQRWQDWWNETGRSMPQAVDRALNRVEEGGEAADVEGARACLSRCAWASIDVVAEAAHAWLHSSDPRLRTDGFRLAASARLGGLADDVASAFRFERHPDVWTAGLASAIALGAPTKGIARPTEFVPDRRFDR